MAQASNGFCSVAALSLPRMLGRRMLLKLVARGGMGDVYLGATIGLEGAERACIVKTVRRDHIHDGSFLARFLDEARVQAQLQHPGVAQVLEAGSDDDGEPYTVVEYVEGRALSDVRQRAIQTGQAIAWADAVAIAIEIAQALAHVHERAGADGTPLGIVHRDLSPQNVMVGYAGEIKLIDFGTARGHNRRCHTVAGVVFAKPGYVAPEVARQQVGDGRIDIYALGILLWELCAGRRFLTTDPQRHLDDAAAGNVVVPPIAAACRAPADLDALIAKLTKNDPDERYVRAALAATDLARVLSTAPPAEGSERGVRARIAQMMRRLWPQEPARSRAEFVRLLREARATLQASQGTPNAGPVSEAIAVRMAADDPRRLSGTPYRLGRKLGEGANGIVYEAEHVELGRKVAVKVLAPDHAGSALSLERFRREARAVASLSHPNLVQLYDFGKSLDGRAYLAMELCAGETLDVRIRRGPLPWRDAIRIAIDTARALEAAHEAGLVHRDIKPQNLILGVPVRGRAGGPQEGTKLLDFGVATALTHAERAATVGEKALRGFAVVGTPEYMAPEQVSGDPVDRRTDLYALGCVLYEMLTGVRAFDGAGAVVVMGMQLREMPAPPRKRAPSQSIPRELDAIVMRAMQKRPESRFGSATAMRVALESALLGPARRRERARQYATVVLSAASMIATAAVAAHWERSRGDTVRAERSGASSPASTADRAAPAASIALDLRTQVPSGGDAVPIAALSPTSAGADIPLTVPLASAYLPARSREGGSGGLRTDGVHTGEPHRKLGRGGNGSTRGEASRASRIVSP